jgi:type I restriction enzyme S subunit
MYQYVLRDLLVESKDGEWGKGEASADSIEMLVIRGTDFEEVRLGSLEAVPNRFIPNRIASRKTLQPFDIIIETAGGSKDRPTGRTLFLKPSLFSKANRPVTCASFARFLRIDSKKADPEYVFWLLQALYASRHLARYHTQHTGVARFQFTTFADNEPLYFPEPKIQRRIASILSVYDDLIENNTRRIAILEEMARRIYEEWFVHFRFPGHEKVRMVESELGLIPEDWQIETLEDCAFVTMGQSPSSEHYNTSGIGLPFHQGVTDFGAHYPSHKNYCSISGRMAKEGDILLSVRAPVGRINLAPSDMVIGRGLCAIRSRSQSQWFLLNRLLERFREEDCMGNGAIFKAVSKQDVLGLKFSKPPEKLQTTFESQVRPIWALLKNLTRKNANLRATRDLLLPKLISGELDVSQLPEPEDIAA